ncbi:MAG: Mur ligase family protein [Patescibacteria group bacterium]
MGKIFKNYNEAVSFIESLSNISPGHERRQPATAKKHLNRVKKFLAFLGNPEKKLKIIHIAGTSGKGSVAVMLHSIFLKAKKNIGLYTSPHTTTYCERFKAGGNFISEKELVRLTNFLKDKMDEFTVNFNTQASSLNFFEFTFCLALLYFTEKKCEYCVIETGCGGRFDSTNAIEKTAYVVITNIGRDHVDIFKNLKNIAYEKSGIIKKGAPTLTGEKNKRWLRVFLREAKRVKSDLRNANHKDIKNLKVGLEGTRFEYMGNNYRLRLLGGHQAKNAVLAINCAKDMGIGISAIKKGLEEAEYPARLEVLSKKPLIIIDGAHNSDKIRAAIDFINISRLAQNGKRYLILAMAKNKKAKSPISCLMEYFDHIYLTRFSNPFRKANNFADWQKIFGEKFAKTSKKKIYYKHHATDALLDILPKLGNNDLLLITGSIFLAGDLRKYWYPEEKIIKFRNSTKR